MYKNSELERLEQSRPNSSRKRHIKKTTICFLSIFLITIVTVIIAAFYLFNRNFSLPHQKWDTYQNESYIPPEISQSTCKALYDEIRPHNDSYVKRIHVEMIKLLFNQSVVESFNQTEIFEKAQNAYLICKKGNFGQFDADIDKLTGAVFKGHTGKSLTESIVFLLQEFNFNTFFNLEIMPNMGEGMAMTAYLSPNPAFYAEIEAPEYQNISTQVQNLYQKLRNISDSPEDSSKWEIWNFETFKDFNFEKLFQKMLKRNLTDFNFVVTNPSYIQSLEKVLAETSPAEMRALFLPALKSSINNYQCDEILEDFFPNIATFLYILTQNSTVIQESRTRLLENFQKLVKIVKSLILPYLHTTQQEELAEEKLKEVELTTEGANWLELDDAVERLNFAYKNLTTNPTILELRKFEFQQKISKIFSKHEALRSFEHDEISMSSTKIFYSKMGNWITVPVAAFLHPNSHSLILELASKIAEIVAFDSFRWSPTGTQRTIGEEIMPSNLGHQNQCFLAHKISGNNFSLSLGLEAAWNFLIDRLSGIEKRNLTKSLANLVISQNTTSSLRIAAGFLERHHENLCINENLLPCFI